jgi:hypothetical protein
MSLFINNEWALVGTSTCPHDLRHKTYIMYQKSMAEYALFRIIPTMILLVGA